MRLKTADASRFRPAARARTAGGRSFAGNGARQDFPFFSVRNNRHFAGKDKFPFLAQTVVFLQARRGAERRIWATRRERNGRAAQQGRDRPERHRRRWKRRRIDRGRARPGKRINARRMRRGWQEMTSARLKGGLCSLASGERRGTALTGGSQRRISTANRGRKSPRKITGEPGRRAEEGDFRERVRSGINDEARGRRFGGAGLGRKAS